MRKSLIALAVLAVVSTAGADWLPASLSSGVWQEFDGVMDETDTTVPVFAGGGFFEKDTYWQVTEDGVDVSTTLGLPGSFPSDGGYNMGTVAEVQGTNDRAIGAFAGDASSRTVALKLVNDSGGALDEVFVEYDVERWMATDHTRNGKARLVLEYAGSSTTLVDFVTIFGLDQPYWNDASFGEFGYGWVDGNADINAVRQLGGMVDLGALGVQIAADDEFVLRWELSEAGNAETKSTGLAVDNVRVAVPEPATGLLLVLGVLGGAFRRRS